MMRYASHINADNITIEVGKLHMEGEAKINTTGRSVVWQAPGDGSTDGNGHGTGGSHGGFGGGNVESEYTKSKCFRWFFSLLLLLLFCSAP